MTCVAFALAIYLTLALVGAPVWLLVRPAAPPVSDAFASPILGLAVLQVFSWWWLRFGHGGMIWGLPILVACALVALAAVGRARRATFRRPSPARCVSTVVLLGAVAAVFVCEFRIPLRAGHLTSASIWNADIALYVNVSAGLVAHGFGWAGNIVGLHLGHASTNAKGIGPGIYSLLAASAAGTGTGTWEAAIPLLLVGVALGALAIRDAARLLLPRNLVAGPVIAVLVTTASLFGYITTNYFLAQVLVMPLALGELLVLHWIAQQTRTRERVAGVVLLTAIVAIAVLSYSPMAFAMQPIILGAVCIAEAGRGWLRRSAQAAIATAGAFVIAWALAPDPFKRSFEFVHVSLKEDKGWPLALMTPLDLLGFHQAVHTPRPVVGLFIFESAIVAAIIAGAVWVLWGTRRRAALVHASAALVVLGSYAAAYAARGYSYEQWKWISFFQPVFMVAVFGLVAAAAAVLLAAWRPHLRVAGGALAAVFGIVLIAVSARMLVTGTRYTRAVWVAGEPSIAWNVVGPSLSGLADRPALAHEHAVNLDLPQWDEMWAAYFLQPKMRVYLLDPSYLPVSPPGARVTLSAHVAPPPGVGKPPIVRYFFVARTPPRAKVAAP